MMFLSNTHTSKGSTIAPFSLFYRIVFACQIFGDSIPRNTFWRNNNPYKRGRAVGICFADDPIFRSPGGFIRSRPFTVSVGPHLYQQASYYFREHYRQCLLLHAQGCDCRSVDSFEIFFEDERKDGSGIPVSDDPTIQTLSYPLPVFFIPRLEVIPRPVFSPKKG